MGTLLVTKYAMKIEKASAARLHFTNLLADFEGRAELYDAKLPPLKEPGKRPHASLDLLRTLPEKVSQWRVAVSAPRPENADVDAFLLNCTGAKNGCFVAAQRKLRPEGATLVADEPQEGDWRVVIRARERTPKIILYRVREVLLTPAV